MVGNTLGGDMEQGYTVRELWGAATRRALPALVVAGGIFALALTVILAVPGEYRAQSTLILEPHRTHPELVTPATTAMLEDRLRVARQQLVSTPLLESVIREVDPYPELTRKKGMAAAVAELRRHLEIHPEGESAVTVAFRTHQRDKAAPVVRHLAEGFVKANADLRTAQSQRVLDILSEELEQVTSALSLKEAAVRDYRLAHDGELPEQVESNLREAERATRLLESAENHVRELERRKSLLQAAPLSPEVARYAEMEADLLRRLNHARSLFHEEHPEPVRLERELAGIRDLKAEALGREKSAGQQLAALNRSIRAGREEAERLELSIGEARERAWAGAMRGAELSVLERDQDILREKYRSLMSRKVESEVALGLEKKSAPLSTRVIDPAMEPSSQSAPARANQALLALLFSLGAGIGVGVLLESRDSTLHTPAQARSQLNLPLLAALPTLKSSPKRRSAGQRKG